MDIKIIAFDADDTLWDNEPLFQDIEKKMCELLSGYGDLEYISSVLFDIEMKNLESYGYGAKAFTLSMIETALKVSNNKIPSEIIGQIIDMGKYLLDMPIQLLEGVSESLEKLNEKYKLVVATKGDLLDQQRKLRRSGLESYFDHVEIMSDKTETEYRKLVKSLNAQADNIMMVGNSLRSDIYPALSVGMYAAYVPYHTMWKHEIADENNTNERFFKIQSLNKLEDILK